MVHLIDAPEDPFIKNRYLMLKYNRTIFRAINPKYNLNQRKLR